MALFIKAIVERWYENLGIVYKKQLNLFHDSIIDLRI